MVEQIQVARAAAHGQHLRRWARDKTDDLQSAFFNGVGYESWENIWGIWNGITPRDAEALRRIATIERGDRADFWSARTGSRTRPRCSTASTPADGRWEIRPSGPSSTAPNTTSTVRRFELPLQAGIRYFDLWHGVELDARKSHGGSAVLSFRDRSPRLRRGAGHARCARCRRLPELCCQSMKQLTAQPLSSLLQRMEVPAADRWSPSPRRSRQPSRLQAWSRFQPAISLSRCTASRSKASTKSASTCSIHGKTPRAATTSTRIHIKSFYIDKYPVTNAEFKKFLDATHYHPQDDTISCTTGRMAPILPAGTTSP